jgi:hypothetical protein
LAQMSELDSNVVRIAEDFTWLKDSLGWPRDPQLLGFRQTRWDEYKRLFRKLGLKMGLSREDGKVFLIASTTGVFFKRRH